MLPQFAFEHIGLVEQDNRLDLDSFRRHQVAVDEHAVGFGHRGDHQDDLVDIGGDRFHGAVGVGPQQLRLAGLAGDNYPVGLPWTPDYLVSRHQAVQVGAQMAALAFALSLDEHLRAVVGDNQPIPLRPQFATGQGLLGLVVSGGGAFAPLFLDLVDPPGLSACELAFTHERILAARRPFAKLLQPQAEASHKVHNRMFSDQNLIWVDMEMTGLDPENDVVIEIATIVTDSELNTLAEGPVLAIYQPDERLDAMDEWNTSHHTSSGLVKRVRNSDEDESSATRKTIKFLEEFVPEGASPMCGNSICQDRRFMARHMPELERYFHYRNLDVSTLKILVQRWRPELAGGLNKSNTHLALDDIRESIEELRYYRETFLQG